MEILGFDEYGHVEMDFTAAKKENYTSIHTIWVEPKKLFKVKEGKTKKPKGSKAKKSKRSE